MAVRMMMRTSAINTHGGIMARRSRTLATGIVVALGLAALAGCAHSGTASPEDSPSPSPSPSASASPSASPSPEGPDLADPSTWLISFDGVGPLVLGQPFTEVPAVMTAFTDRTTDQCRVAMFDAGSVPSMWVVPEGETIHEVLVGAAIIGKTVVEVQRGTPKTGEGIGIGATLDQLQSANPGAAQVDLSGTPGSEEIYYSVSNGTDRWILFRIVDGLVDAVSVSDEPLPPYEYCG